jgi:hypothetical protein
MAADILTVYYPWPLTANDPQLSASGLLAMGLRLCNSVKSVHADSGALLCALVYSR